jgi:hypothetical protein
MPEQSLRAKLLERRTYLRPIDDEGIIFETTEQALDRQIGHQRYLWENAKKAQFKHLLITALELGKQARRLSEAGDNEGAEGLWYDAAAMREVFDATWPLTADENAELAELRALIASRKASLSGRVKWMGGTDVIKERPSAAFNCSFSDIKIPADIVDAFWLLLQGCGVGFKPRVGMLTGFPQAMEVEIVPSTRTARGGNDDTVETFDGETWTIKFGDSAKGWAKAVGKLTANKYRASKLVLDFSELRPAGQRLRGYGWISSGWEPFADGLKIIVDVLNKRVGQYLNTLDIGDIINALGTVLSSRRSAQIWIVEDDSPELMDFMHCKDRDAHGSILEGKVWREQSNNSIAFNARPGKGLLKALLENVLKGGEPGLYNLEAARRGLPWVEGTNPCGEIRLPSKGFCNLVQIVWHRFNDDFEGLKRATYIMARANYRQTLVSMKDGVLQLQWDDNNKLLRLCGVSPSGIVGSDIEYDGAKMEILRYIATEGANSMADEVGTSRAALVTQVQPSGTGSKVMGEIGDEVQEGAHMSPTRFLFNNVMFSKFDPLVEKARAAGYTVKDHPTQPTAVLVVMPVAYAASQMYRKQTLANGETIEVSVESAIDQLERYKRLMDHWVQHNCSITISYDPEEINDIVDWLYDNWDSYVGVSFLRRNDPTKTAEDLGFAYLPQEAVSEERYWAYVESLAPIALDDDTEQGGLDELTACATGACPIK